MWPWVESQKDTREQMHASRECFIWKEKGDRGQMYLAVSENCSVIPRERVIDDDGADLVKNLTPRPADTKSGVEC